MGLLLLSGCPSAPAEDPGFEARLAALEEKARQLDSEEFGGPNLRERVEALEAAREARASAAKDPTAAQEDAAGQLYREAKDASGAGRTDEAIALLDRIQAEHPRTRVARRAVRTRAELGLVGADAPAIAVEEWYSGSAARLDLRSGTTLLVFWEVWCPHCKREVPKLQALHEKYDGRLSIVGLTKLTKSASEEKVRQFLADNGVTYAVAKETGAASRAYEVSGIPAAAVVRDGHIIWRGHPANLSDELLETWM